MKNVLNKSNSFSLVWVFFYLVVSFSFADQPLRDKLELALLELPASGRSVESLVERKSFNGVYMDDVKGEILKNWKGSFSLLSDDRVSGGGKMLLIRLTQTLPIDHYVEFLDDLVSASEVGGVEPFFLDAALRPNTKELRGMWYDDQCRTKIVELASRLEVFYDGDIRRREFFRKVIAGEVIKPPVGSGAHSKKERDDLRLSNSEDLGGNESEEGDGSTNAVRNYALCVSALLILGFLLFKTWRRKSVN